MKQFLTILRFEYLNYAKNKIFVGITAFLVLLIGVVLCFPRFTQSAPSTPEVGSEAQQGGTSVEANVGDKFERNAALVESSGNAEASVAFFAQAMPDVDFTLLNSDEESLKTAIGNGEYDFALMIESPTKYKLIVKDVGMYDTTEMIISEIMVAKYRFEAMQSLGISPQDAQEILNPAIESETVKIGKDQFSSFFYTYILIFALYMAILLYGQFVATSVASEKSSRAMELLITSAKPVNLMFGKVIGSGLAGLTQMVAILGSAFAFYKLNAEYWGDNMIINSIFDMPLSILLYTLLFFILGFFIYAFMYGALGSLTSRSEDVSTSIMPVTFLFIIGFFIVIFSMSEGNVDSTLMKVASFIPFTSPMAMFTRIAMGNVEAWEIILSVVILFASTIGIGYIAAGIYRIGVLLYGKPPKLNQVFKMLKSSKK